MHAVGFIVLGHAKVTSGLATSAPFAAFVVEITPEPSLEQDEPLAASERRESGSFVPPPTHTHAYPVPLDHDAHPHDPSLVHLPFAVSPSPPPESVVAAPEAPARFTMVVTGQNPLSVTVAPSTRPSGSAEPGVDALPLPEDGISSPARLERPMSPVYPAAARAQEVEADVVLAIVVTATGEVADARVIRPAGFGFDEEALRAVRGARFTPAERDGQRVAVRMRWSVSFRLR
ncbi:MAG: TonB family protein [Myxococcota bacterium]|nr:TonB family protein [Myxococcota bacterium]